MSIVKPLVLSFVIFILMSCSAPRNIIHSGKVTSKGKAQFGANFSYNISTETAKELYGSLNDAIKQTVKSDSVFIDEEFNQQARSLAMYSIDPLSSSFDLYIRYGLIENIDIGYAWSSGVHVIDSRYQFLNKDQKYYGSAGLQFSSQSYELPSYLGDLQSFLKYELKRKDLLIPIIFSTSFGEQEKYGAFGYGISYGRSWITYDYEPNKLYELVAGEVKEVNDVPQGENSYNTYGFILNLKAGYKPFYFLVGLSSYYQDYGKYNLFKDEYAEFSGMTFVPNIGIQFSF